MSLTFICVKPVVSDYLKENLNITYTEGMPLEKYNDFMRKNRFDIGFAPLEDNIFNNRKYFNKYYEYSKVGIMGMYSDCKPFTYAVTNGKNGILVSNNVDAWYKAIEKIILNKDKIIKIVNQAQEDLINKFNVDMVSQKLIFQFPKILGKQELKIKPILECKDSLLDLLYIFAIRVYIGVNCLKKNGIRGGIKFVKAFIYNRRH